MTRILDTTLPLASRRDICHAVGRGSFRTHRACRSELRPLPARVASTVRCNYRAKRRAGHSITEARTVALVYLDGYADGWNERMLRWQDRMIEEGRVLLPGSDAWYAWQAASA